MFEYLDKFNIILLSGPHRSGTTIVSNMIANDLKIKLFYEEDVTWLENELYRGKKRPIPHLWNWFFDLQRSKGIDKFVIQCPSHAHALHNYAGVDGLAVVFIRRDIKSIIASQSRIGWGFEEMEIKKRYGGEKNTPISVIKYREWNTSQKDILEQTGQAFEIEHSNLAQHPMWVKKEDRKNFTSRQIRIKEPRGDKSQNKIKQRGMNGLVASPKKTVARATKPTIKKKTPPVTSIKRTITVEKKTPPPTPMAPPEPTPPLSEPEPLKIIPPRPCRINKGKV